MKAIPSETEILQFLKAIEEGVVCLRPEWEPQDVYSGNVPYAASNGWRIVVYNDANEWDYIDRVETADGRIWEYPDLLPPAAVGQYQPDDEIAWRRYGIPGYMRFRCRSCSLDLEVGLRRPPFLCPLCRTKMEAK